MTEVAIFPSFDGRLRSADNDYERACNGEVTHFDKVDQVGLTDKLLYVGQNKESKTPKYRLHQSFLEFDTEANVPLGARVDSVTLRFVANSVSQTSTPWEVELYAYDWVEAEGDVLEAADWRTPAMLKAMTKLSHKAPTKPGTFTLPTSPEFVAAVNRYGPTRVMLSSNRFRSENDPDGGQLASFFSRDNADPYTRCYLVVKYTLLVELPTISDVEPLSGHQGDLVTITGANFPADSQVFFDGDEGSTAAEIVSWSDSQLIVRVPYISAGQAFLWVSCSSGETEQVAFTVTQNPPAPVLDSVTPVAGAIGDVVTLRGSGFNSGKTVKFGTTPATIINWTETTIGVWVPEGLSNGALSVTVESPWGTSAGKTFTVQAGHALLPNISHVTPATGAVGDEVQISGVNFASDSVVKFGTTVAVILFLDPDGLFIDALVPAGLSPGAVNITVTTSAGVGSSFSFTVGATNAPVITAIVPSSGPEGSWVEIQGSNFGVAGLVRVDGVAVATADWTRTSISAEMPPTLTTGPHLVVVRTPAIGGVESASAIFTVITSTPSRLSTVIAANATEFVATSDGNVRRVTTPADREYQLSGSLTSSFSSLKVAGPKYLHHVAIAHDPVGVGEQIGLTLIADGRELDELVVTETDQLMTELPVSDVDGNVGVLASRIQYILRITGPGGASPVPHSILIFATLPSVQRYQYVLKAIGQAGDANDLPMQDDPGPKLSYLRALRRSAKVVSVQSRQDGSFEARIEKAQRAAIKVAEHDYSEEQGIVILVVREM
jgi:hypothetical protein